MTTTTVACSLSNGLVLGYTSATPNGQPQPVTLNPAPAVGVNLGNIPTVSFTQIDSDWWSDWIAASASDPFVVNGVVWEA